MFWMGVEIAAGLYFAFGAFIISTEDFQSTLAFKGISGIFSFLLLIHGLRGVI